MSRMSDPAEFIYFCAGLPKQVQWEGQEVETSIFKEPLSKAAFATRFHLTGDGQADLVHHGGLDKALNAYSFEHYAFWEQNLGATLPPSAFGENLTVKGMLESDICVGDIYRIGEAVVQVSQPRVPCFKINIRFARKDVLSKVVETGYTGFYLRVLEEGSIAPDSKIELLEEHGAGVTVQSLTHLRVHGQNNLVAMEEAIQLEPLAEVWKGLFRSRLEKAK